MNICIAQISTDKKGERVHDLQVDRDSSGTSPSIIYSTFKISSGLQTDRVRDFSRSHYSVCIHRPGAGEKIKNKKKCRQQYNITVDTVFLSETRLILTFVFKIAGSRYGEDVRVLCLLFNQPPPHKSLQTCVKCERGKCDTTSLMVLVPTCEKYNRV